MLCVVCVCVSGVYATWKYTQNKIEDKQNQISLGLDEFVFTPEEVLPDLQGYSVHSLKVSSIHRIHG